jgi:hypothetical protein
MQAYPGVSTRVVRLKTLLEMNRAAAQPQDVIDIEELRCIQ